MSKGHSLPRGHEERESSEIASNERGALTSWRAHRDGLVRTWKGSERARGTHSLESASGWTSQNMERKRASKGHSLAGERIGMD
jgi:hypothetical protein